MDFVIRPSQLFRPSDFVIRNSSRSPRLRGGVSLKSNVQASLPAASLCRRELVDATGFIKERVGVFKDFSNEQLKQLVDASVVRSFETNEAVSYQGAEASHFGVVLSGT